MASGSGNGDFETSDASGFDVRYFPDYNTGYVYLATTRYDSVSGHYGLSFWRVGISGGAISVGTEYWVKKDGADNYYYYPTVGVGTDGNVYVGMSFGASTSQYFQAYHNANNDGSATWSNIFHSGSAITTGVDFWHGTVQQLASGKVLFIYLNQAVSPYVRSRYGSGTSFDTEVTVPIASTDGVSDWRFSAAVDPSGNVILSMGLSTIQYAVALCVQKYTTSTKSWLTTNEDNQIQIGIVDGVSVDSSGNAWMFYGYNGGNSYLKVIERYSGGSYSSSITISDNGWSNPFAIGYEMNGSYVGILWEDTYDSSSNIYFDTFTYSSIPPTYSLSVPSYNTTVAGKTCLFSVIWNDPNNNLSKAFYSTNISGSWVPNQTISLSWINSSAAWANWTATLPVGSLVVYNWICNNTAGTWNTAMANQTLTTTNAITITSLGTTSSTSYYSGGNVAAPLFDGCIVFWRNKVNGNFSLTAFNLTSNTFSDVWNSSGKNLQSGSAPTQESPTVIGNTLYAAFFNGSFSTDYYTTVIYTSDLSTFTTLGTVYLALESICNYTGGGRYNNSLYFGGYQSNGSGTYASIGVWYNSNFNILWNATLTHSNDAFALTMYNTTEMIGSECAPNNIIYTNDGVDFAQEYNGYTNTYTSEYPFVWAWSTCVTSGTAYLAASSSPTPSGGPSYGGMATWRGYNGSYIPTSWNPSNLYAVTNGLAGGSDNVLNSTGWTGTPAIFTYSSIGSELDEIWHNSTDVGAVLSLVYSNGTYYALYYDQISRNVTIMSITQASTTVQEFPSVWLIVVAVLLVEAYSAWLLRTRLKARKKLNRIVQNETCLARVDDALRGLARVFSEMPMFPLSSFKLLARHAEEVYEQKLRRQ
jgi:hypothetical protein